MALIIDDVLQIGKTIIEKIFPNKDEAEKAKIRLIELEQQGQLKIEEFNTQLLQGQIETNKIEAASPSIFKSGWRPFIGWTCAGCIGMYYIPQFVLASILWVHQCLITNQLMPFPVNADQLMWLTFNLLGIAGLRSFDKFNFGGK